MKFFFSIFCQDLFKQAVCLSTKACANSIKLYGPVKIMSLHCE